MAKSQAPVSIRRPEGAPSPRGRTVNLNVLFRRAASIRTPASFDSRAAPLADEGQTILMEHGPIDDPSLRQP
jgi:hypothetical protein